ncbi:MAG: hypothetical protein E6K39_16070, partial [Gammaproteobacteria bacterium]
CGTDLRRAHHDDRRWAVSQGYQRPVRNLLGLGILAIPVSVLVTLSVINAFNFIDGLAASMALIALTAGGLATGLRRRRQEDSRRGEWG